MVFRRRDDLGPGRDRLGEAYEAMVRGARRAGRPGSGPQELGEREDLAFDPARPPARDDLVYRPGEDAVGLWRTAAPRPDPRTTEVFQPGPDGKLHPVEGWTTTGPFEFGTWARNVGWPKAARDMAGVVGGALGGGVAPGRPSYSGVAGVAGRGASTTDRAGLAAGVYGAGDDVLSAVEKSGPARGRRRIDPRRTEVFQPGPDGKLHPVEGWTTTGPFDGRRWSRNIDWTGVARDLGRIAAGSLAGLSAPGLASQMGTTGVVGTGLSRADLMGLLGGVYLHGDKALEEIEPSQRPEFR